jgi:hypothetical protein
MDGGPVSAFKGGGADWAAGYAAAAEVAVRLDEDELETETTHLAWA